jgi:hypothetical protein
VEITKEFGSQVIAGRIHWMLESTTVEMFNYVNAQYGAIETTLNYSTLLTMSAQDALTAVLLALGTEEVARLEQFGEEQLLQTVIPVVEFVPPPAATPPVAPPAPEGPAP